MRLAKLWKAWKNGKKYLETKRKQGEDMEEMLASIVFKRSL